MTPEQLQKTRAVRWRQDGNALLTLEDAEEWLRPIGLCLFMPRRVQLPTSAPSFVQACLGEANPAPPLPAIEHATTLLTRLVDKGAALPLNLLGISGEQPDFIVTPEALPFVFALRGDKDWKHEPQTAGNGRVSPLVLGIWKALERTGVQTAVEIRESMGKELTEAAVLRGLSELWNSMRVIMLPGERGEAATWELLKTRFQKQMAAGSSMSQVSALSVLLAQYLESVVGATSEEAEVFLSPLSSRSKVRDVVRGLTATRQLEMIGLDGQAILYLEGTLPEFEQPASQVTIEALAAESAGTDEPMAPAPATRIKQFKKHTQRPPRAPGEVDPLRWKRDRSVPPPPGETRGLRSAPRHPGSRPQAARDGFDRRSTPARPGADNPRAEARAPHPEQPAGRPPQRPAEQAGGSARPKRQGYGKPPFRTAPFGKPGFGKPESGKPGFEKSGSGRPEFETSGSARPGSGSYGFGKPGFERSRPGQAGSAKSGFRKAGFGKPPVGVPGNEKPQNGASQFDRSGSATPRANFTNPERARRPFTKPGFKSQGNRPGAAPPASWNPAARGAFGRSQGDQPGSGAQNIPPERSTGGFNKKPRWVPRTGGAIDPAGSSGAGNAERSNSGRAKRNFSSRTRPQAAGGSRNFGKPAGGGFKPRGDRPFSSRSPLERPATPDRTEKKPRWVPREGGGRPPANRSPSANSPGGRPLSSSQPPGRPAAGGFKPRGDRAFSSRPPSPRAESSRPATSRPASPGSFERKPGGFPPRHGGTPRPRGANQAGFGKDPTRRPGGKPVFGKPGGRPPSAKRPKPPRAPGDFSKRKRPE